MWVSNAASELQSEVAESARADDVADISSQTTGVKSPNLFAGFTDDGLTIATIGGVKFAQRPPFSPIIQSNYAALDMEVSGYSHQNVMYIRYNGSGAIYFANQGGTPTIGYVESGLDLYSTTGYLPPTTAVRSPIGFLDLGTVPGYSGNVATDVWTLGAVGMDIYIKYNGVEVRRFREYRWMKPGTAVIVGGQYTSGTSNVTVKYLPTAMTYSNRRAGFYDIRDFGASTFNTTGSMTGGSATLTVADASGISVGQTLIVETSGESGAGLPGTYGVGGAWPRLSYADTTAMNLDTNPSQTVAWDRSSGLVYLWSHSSAPGVWSKNMAYNINDPEAMGTLDYGEYYSARAAPRALVGVVLSKSGTSITLDKTATVSTTNTRVYVDNRPAFFVLWDDGDGSSRTISNVTIRVPPGSYAISETMPVLAGKNGWTLRGFRGRAADTKLFAPRGAKNIETNWFSNNYAAVLDLSFEGNHKPNPANRNRPIYYWPPTFGDANEYINVGWSGPVNVSNSQGFVVKNVHITDTFRGIGLNGSSRDCCITDCTGTMNARVMAYTQWFFAAVNGTNNCYTRIHVPYSIGIMKAFETFVGVANKYVDCGGYNVHCSTNNSYNWVFDGFYSDIYADCFSYVKSGYYAEGVININNNAYNSSSAGGDMINPRVVEHGYINANNDTQRLLQLVTGVTNVRITGQYESDTTPFVDGKGGFFRSLPHNIVSSDPSRPGSSGYGPSDGNVVELSENCVFRGIRVVVDSPTSGQPMMRITSPGAGSTIVNNIFDSPVIVGTPAVKTGNRTNAGVAIP